jgi:CO/xanthine dehydrogenase FAD-binding subunit
MTQALHFSRPETVAQALQLVAEGEAVPLAGGTDYYAARVGRLPQGHLVDVAGIEELRGISRTADGGWRIGGATTWTAVLRANLPPAFHALRLAAREVGGVQVQNTGTVAGNLCNASPAADGVPPLLALDASVELRHRDGERTLPLARFLLGPRRTALRPGELLTAVLVPPAAASGHSSFAKIGARRYLLISIVMVAANVELDADRRLRRVAVSVGACSPVATRLPRLEHRLQGVAAAELPRMTIISDDLEGLSPIDDVRASAAYRLEAAATLVRRVLIESCQP